MKPNEKNKARNISNYFSFVTKMVMFFFRKEKTRFISKLNS